ncbi:MAG: redoxin family protein [Phycisphaeraceae bacterium]|nr:redoxin family protein [Phycisphaeraceae bacterium]
MRHLFAGLFASAVVLAAPALAQGQLVVGDKAPKLSNVTWLKGDSVSSWQPGEVYVLDFWAPWCGPCIAAMPHMNDLHKKYEDKGVTILGVSIWPRPGMTPTAEFIESHVVNADANEKMLYGIAEDIEMATARAFMDATGSQGIPTVMIVDKQGRLAWVGHPMNKDFDESLDAIVNDTYDIEARAVESRRKAEIEATVRPILSSLREAAGARQWDVVVSKLDELIAMDYNAAQYTLTKVNVLATHLKKYDQAWATGWAAIKGVAKDDAQGLNGLAWFIVDSKAIETRDLDLAMAAATRASELTGGTNASILDTLAHVHYRKGDRAKAIEVQKKAIENAPNPRERQQLQDTLARFESGQPLD